MQKQRGPCVQAPCRGCMVSRHCPHQHVRYHTTVMLLVTSFFFLFASWDRRLPVIASRLYHYNPWMDTATGECSSFQLYLSNPTNFFMRRFAGMTLPVANFLVENVFCILDDPTDDSQRIGAREFGVWIRDLPTLIGASQPLTYAHTHSRVPSTASVSGHPIASAPASRRPASRPASAAGGSPRRPPAVLRVISQNPTDPVLDHDGPDGTLSPALDLVLNEEDEDEEQQQQRDEQQAEDGLRSLSTTKRRKRGRKGKGMTPSIDHTQKSERLALASQTLVRELSRQTRSTTVSTPTFLEVPPAKPAPPAPAPVSPSVTKKQSRWKLSFGKSAAETAFSGRSDSRSTNSTSTSGSARATNVANLINGLNPASPSQSQVPPVPPLHLQSPLRGRQAAPPEEVLSFSPQAKRGASPTSTRSGRPLASSSSSTTSSNWRNSMSSTNTSTSTFTRYSNQSMRSISTFATSVSATSSASSSTNWRNPQSPTFPSSSSLASSVHSSVHSSSSKSQNSNNNNTLPRRAPSNVKSTYFLWPSSPGIHLTVLHSNDWCSVGAFVRASRTPRQEHGHLWRTTAATTRAQACGTREGQATCNERRCKERTRTDQRAPFKPNQAGCSDEHDGFGGSGTSGSVASGLGRCGLRRNGRAGWRRWRRGTKGT